MSGKKKLSAVGTTMGRMRRWGILVAVIILASVGAGAGRAAVAAADTAGAADAELQRRLEDPASLPGRARAVLFAVRDRMVAGEWDAAAADMGAYLAKHPDQDVPLLRQQYGLALLRTGAADSALTELRPRRRRGAALRARVARSRRRRLPRRRRRGRGRRLHRGVASAAGRRPELLANAAICRVQSDRPADAVELLRPLVRGERGPVRLPWCHALAVAGAAASDTAASNLAARTAVAVFPDDPEAWRLASGVAAQAGRDGAAAVALETAALLASPGRSELLSLGDLYLRAGAPLAAAARYEQALADSADVPELERLAAAYQAAGRDDRAAAVLERALAMSPSAHLWSLLGDLRYGRDDLAGALEAYRESAALDPAAARIQLLRGWCALATDHPGEAREALQAAARDSAFARDAKALLERLARGDAPPR